MAISFERTEKMLRVALDVEHRLGNVIAKLVGGITMDALPKFIRSRHHAHATERLRYVVAHIQEQQAEIEAIKAQAVPVKADTTLSYNKKSSSENKNYFSIPDIRKILSKKLEEHTLDFKFRSLKGGCQFYAIRFTSRFLVDTHKVGELYDEIRKELLACGYSMTASKGVGALADTRIISIMRGAPDIHVLESGTQIPAMPAGYLLTSRPEVQSRMGY
jgi:hypothetical protein